MTHLHAGGTVVVVAILIAANVPSLAHAAPDRDAEALISAAGAGDLGHVRELIEGGARVDARDDTGVTALIEAAYAGELRVVSYLIERGADVNAADEAGATPLTEALRDDHTDVALALVRRGANVNVQDGEGRTPLIRAAALGDRNLLRAVLDAGADVNAKAKTGTALSRAVANDDLRTAQLLVGAGADPDPFQPLEVAANREDLNMAKLLLDAGATPTPWFMRFVAKTDWKLADSLLKTREVRTRENLDWALKGAIEGGNLKLVTSLVGFGANLNDQMTTGPALGTAITSGADKKLVRYLIDAGADLDLTIYLPSDVGKDLQTRDLPPASYAAVVGRRDIVAMLADSGADMGGAVFALIPIRESGPEAPDAKVAALLEILFDGGAPSDEVIQMAIGKWSDSGLVRRWLPYVSDWGKHEGNRFVVSYLYEDLVRFADEKRECGLKAEVKRRFQSATGVRPPMEYSSSRCS